MNDHTIAIRPGRGSTMPAMSWKSQQTIIAEQFEDLRVGRRQRQVAARRGWTQDHISWLKKFLKSGPLYAHGQCLGSAAVDREDGAGNTGAVTGHQQALASEPTTEAAQSVGEDGW